MFSTSGLLYMAVCTIIVMVPPFVYAIRNNRKRPPILDFPPLRPSASEARRTIPVMPAPEAPELCVCGHATKSHAGGGGCSDSVRVSGVAKLVRCCCSSYRPKNAKAMQPEAEARKEETPAPAPMMTTAPLADSSSVAPVPPARKAPEQTYVKPSLLEFFGLCEQPFGVTPDPAYLYLGKTHREALASLQYAIKSDRGFAALIAKPGMGKTTLLYQLLEGLRETARTVFVFQTQCTSREFYRHVLSELGVDTLGMDLVAMHDQLNHMLFQEMLAGKRFVLVVDEAQNLEEPVLETIRLLSDYETPHAKLLEIVLAGQPELAIKLGQHNLSQLRQRISVVSRLEPLNAAETPRYIEHRLAVAGYSGGLLFAPDAVARIAERSHGIPRNINNLCFNAMTLAYAEGRRTVTSELVQEVTERLDLETIAAQARGAAAPAPARAAVAAPAPAEVSPVPAPAAALPAPAPVVVSPAPPAAVSPARPIAVSPVPPRTPAPAAAAPAPSVAASAAIPSPIQATAAAKVTTPFVPVPPPRAAAYGPAATRRAPEFPAYRYQYQLSPARGFGRTALRAAAVIIVLLAGGALLFPTLKNLYQSRLSAAARNTSTEVVIPAATETSTPDQTPPFPAPEPAVGARTSRSTAHPAAMPQTLYVVTAPHQSLRDLCLLYVGRYDDKLVAEIQALNPNLRDLNQLDPGLILQLPLPAGALKLGYDTAGASETAKKLPGS